MREELLSACPSRGPHPSRSSRIPVLPLCMEKARPGEGQGPVLVTQGMVRVREAPVCPEAQGSTLPHQPGFPLLVFPGSLPSGSVCCITADKWLSSVYNKSSLLHPWSFPAEGPPSHTLGLSGADGTEQSTRPEKGQENGYKIT